MLEELSDKVGFLNELQKKMAFPIGHNFNLSQKIIIMQFTYV